MSSIVVAYASFEGQAQRIAEDVARWAREAGHAVRLVDTAAPPPDLGEQAVDAVLVVTSIHVGRHSEAAHRFVSAHRALLEGVPTALLSVSLSAAGGEGRRAEAEGYVARFLEETGWRPTMAGLAAGALRYREYGLLKRVLMRWIARSGGLPTDASRDHEFTDWKEVRHFTDEFLRQVRGPAARAEPSDDEAGLARAGSEAR